MRFEDSAALKVTAVAASAALLFMAVRNCGLSAAQAALGALMLGAAFLPPGWLLTRRSGAGILTAGERLALAAAVGYAVASPAYYFLSLAGADRAFLPLSVLLAAVAAGRRDAGGRRLAWAREAARLPAALWRSADGPLLAMTCFGIWMLTRQAGAFVEAGGRLAYRAPTPDHLLHISFYWEMLRGMPPAEFPTAAGVPFPPYHVFAYMPGVFLARHGGLDPVTVYHGVMPLLHLSLLAAVFYLALRLRTGRKVVAAAGLAGLLLVSPAMELLTRNTLIAGKAVPITFFLRSVSGGGGMVVWGTVFALLFLRERQRGQGGGGVGTLYLAALLAGFSWFFKAQLFLLCAPAFLGALLLCWWREGGPHLPAAAALTVGVTLLCHLSWPPAGSFGGPLWAPGIFARRYVYPALARGRWPFLREVLLPFFKDFPGGYGWLLATPLGLWRLFHFSPLGPAWLWSVLRRGRAAGAGDVALAMIAPVALVLAFFMGDAGVYGRVGGHMFREATHFLPMISVALNTACLAWLLDRLGLAGGRTVLVAALGASLLILPLHWQRTGRVRPKHLVPISRDLAGALEFLRLRTPADAVVADAMSEAVPAMRRRSRRFNQYPVIAALGGRRTVLGYYWDGIDRRHRRRHDLLTLFSTRDRARAWAVIRRYRVDYIVEFAARPLRFPRKALEEVYGSATVRVLKVARAPGAP